MLLRQADVQRTQLQLATQLRVLKPSDDPVAATAINSLSAEINQLEQFNRNADAADANNKLEETILTGVTDILFRVRELTVSLGNGAYSSEAYTNIGVELEERLNELLGLANTKNANGDYLFSGSQVGQQPFTKDAAGNISYQGDQSQRLLRVSSGVVEPVSDSGFDVFVDIPSGNGKFSVASNPANTGTSVISAGSYQAPPNFLAEAYSITFGVDANNQTIYSITGDTTGTAVATNVIYQEGETISFNGISVEVKGQPASGDSLSISPSKKQNVFTTIKKAIDAIKSFEESPSGRATFQNVLTDTQESLNNSMENIDLVRGRIGSRLNSIESEININLSMIITSKSSLSDIRDLDTVEAATRFSQQLTVLEAAQSSFVRLQNLNLFNFL